MKKFQNKVLSFAATTALILAAFAGTAQVSKDTVKPGKTNDQMVVDPQRSTDGMRVNRGKPAEGMAVLTDTGFINKNIADNIMEIQLSKIGLNKGTGQQVKKLARQMVADHTAILNALKKLAATAMAPTAPSNPGRSAMPTASEGLIEEGKDFNASWASKMLTMHEAKISELESFLPVTQNAELKAVIGVALPKIRAHRDMLSKIPGAEVKKVPNAVIL